MDTYGYKSMVESLDTVQMTERQRAQAVAQARLCADILALFHGIGSLFGANRGA